MKTPRRDLKASQLLQITIQYSGRSYQAKKRFTLPFNILAGTVKPFRVAPAELVV